MNRGDTKEEKAEDPSDTPEKERQQGCVRWGLENRRRDRLPRTWDQPSALKSTESQRTGQVGHLLPGSHSTRMPGEETEAPPGEGVCPRPHCCTAEGRRRSGKRGARGQGREEGERQYKDG